MGDEGQVCPVCGQPVEAVVRRRKTLGAWVPVWEPGPCRNPECRESDSRAGRRPQQAPAETDVPQARPRSDGPEARPGSAEEA
ncbi:hypothetical protein [Streptomyces carpinensis]|uniref:hypothetical protein n=1 Tax=Streptomyces carpinensis TaxID=66369 RepID=UPI000A37B436|nr:hypothetical protein [Streptomyces carpinensis]